jgi:putative hydrolase of HD superfamily
MSSQQVQSVLDFYILANKLKETIRTGWKLWEISAPRLESVAEHVYGTQMLAIAIISEYKIDVDLRKVILMLAIHELGEAIIGDITPWDDMTREEKSRIELAAVEKVLSKLVMGDEIRDIYIEFEENQTKEARFCKQTDKLEACLQVKLYEDAGFSDYAKTKTGKLEERRRYHLGKGNDTLSKAWINNEIEPGIYSGEFLELAKFIRDNDMKDKND